MPVLLIDKLPRQSGISEYALVQTAIGPVCLAGRGLLLEYVIFPSITGKIWENSCPEYRKNDNFLPLLQQSLIDYFQGKPVDFDCQIDVHWATVFELKVLQNCSSIPLGKSISYQQLAQQSGNPKAARAVGAVMAKNRTPILIPCHRVIRSDGGLGGYSAGTGLEMKQLLLALEKKLMKTVLPNKDRNHMELPVLEMGRKIKPTDIRRPSVGGSAAKGN